MTLKTAAARGVSVLSFSQSTKQSFALARDVVPGAGYLADRCFSLRPERRSAPGAPRGLLL